MAPCVHRGSDTVPYLPDIGPKEGPLWTQKGVQKGAFRGIQGSRLSPDYHFCLLPK